MEVEMATPENDLPPVRWDTCKNCNGRICGPDYPTALPEIWLHESGGTSCHYVGNEQPPHLQAARAEPVTPNADHDDFGAYEADDYR